jgi:hypothetical protein
MLEVNNGTRENEDHRKGKENAFQGCVWILATETVMADGIKANLP